MRRASRHPRCLLGALAAMSIVACATEQPGQTTIIVPPTSDDDGSSGEPANYGARDGCSAFPQSGCPAETHTCQVVTLGGETRCTSAGTFPRGAPCGGASECALGLTCAYAVCRGFCETADDCAGPGVSCVPILTNDDVAVAGAKVCTTPCNPADPQNAGGESGLVGCPLGDGCAVIPSFDGATECVTAGSSPVGAPCSSTGDCVPGATCVNFGDFTQCTQVCLVGRASCNCQSLDQPDYVTLEDGSWEVGICQ